MPEGILSVAQGGGKCLLLQKAKRFGDVYRISLRNGFKAQKLAV